MWRDAPKAYGPHKTIYNRFIRWNRMGVFNRIFAELAGRAGEPDRIMTDATDPKAHRTAASLLKGGSSPRYRRTKGGLNPKLHAVCDGLGRTIIMLLTEGQMSDHKVAPLRFVRFLTPRNCLAIRAMTATGSGQRWSSAGSPTAFRRAPTVRSSITTTRNSTASATRLRTSSEGSRTGAVSPLAMIAAHALSCLPPSPQPSHTGCHQ